MIFWFSKIFNGVKLKRFESSGLTVFESWIVWSKSIRIMSMHKNTNTTISVYRIRAEKKVSFKIFYEFVRNEKEKLPIFFQYWVNDKRMLVIKEIIFKIMYGEWNEWIWINYAKMSKTFFFWAEYCVVLALFSGLLTESIFNIFYPQIYKIGIKTFRQLGIYGNVKHTLLFFQKLITYWTNKDENVSRKSGKVLKEMWNS